jgi:hypothetical protein
MGMNCFLKSQIFNLKKILAKIIAIGEGSSGLGLLSGGPPLSLFDMRQERFQELDVPRRFFFKTVRQNNAVLCRVAL